MQLLTLEAAARALADAGYADRQFDRVAGVGDLRGRGRHRPVGRLRAPRPAAHLPAAGRGGSRAAARGLDDYLPELTEDSFPGVLANVIAGRIANRLDLGGVNYTVDAACASSLAALDLACKELVGGTSDLVLCGGADLHNGINDFLLFASVHALSPTGRCRTFDAAADGIALGEGVACVVLKRLVDAERDGDRIYAVVEAVRGVVRRPRPRAHRARGPRASAGRSSGPTPRRGARRPASAWSRPTAPARSSATAPSCRRSPRCSPSHGASPARACWARSSRRSATPSARPAWPG